MLRAECLMRRRLVLGVVGKGFAIVQGERTGEIDYGEALCQEMRNKCMRMINEEVPKSRNKAPLA